jgi:Kdo2-lipid IVA lauroyltransferase/acyltransferase
VAFRLFVYPLLWLISVLPFGVLYGLSNLLYLLLYRVFGYRVKVVRDNLERSFPEKTIEERKTIERKFYKHLADLMLETIKGMSISESELRKRMRLADPSFFEKLAEEGKSVIVVMSHCGNWEWVCLAADISVSQHAQCVYKTLSNPNWERWFYYVRSRFGTEPFPMEKTLRHMSANAHKLTATAFIGDQNPANGKNAYWTQFLHQDTCFMQGSEKIARKLGHAVCYLKAEKVKRGYYVCQLEMLCENPSQTQDGEITEMIVRATEKDVISQPENWLWSHRRWKHKRN